MGGKSPAQGGGNKTGCTPLGSDLWQGMEGDKKERARESEKPRERKIERQHEKQNEHRKAEQRGSARTSLNRIIQIKPQRERGREREREQICNQGKKINKKNTFSPILYSIPKSVSPFQRKILKRVI